MPWVLFAAIAVVGTVVVWYERRAQAAVASLQAANALPPPPPVPPPPTTTPTGTVATAPPPAAVTPTATYNGVGITLTPPGPQAQGSVKAPQWTAFFTFSDAPMTALGPTSAAALAAAATIIDAAGVSNAVTYRGIAITLSPPAPPAPSDPSVMQGISLPPRWGASFTLPYAGGPPPGPGQGQQTVYGTTSATALAAAKVAIDNTLAARPPAGGPQMP